MQPPVAEKASPGLSMAGVAQVLETYAGTKAEWWLKPVHENDGVGDDRCKRQTELVVEAPGQPITTWPLNTKTHGGLVRRLAQQPAQGFAIPHLRNYQYDEYALLPALKARCQELLHELEPEVNELLQRIYALDDTAGVAVTAAEAWWHQAEQVKDLSRWYVLRGLQKTVGPPYYLKHSSQLQEVLPLAQEGLRELRRFLDEVPSPGPALAAGPDEARTPGDGSRFPFRHVLTADINRSSTFYRANFDDGHSTAFPETPAGEGAAPEPPASRPPSAPDVDSRSEVKEQLGPAPAAR